MNCAVHNEVPAVAYCRTCGKAVCEQCKRDVRGVIYCEDCLASRVEGTLPPGAAASGLPTATVGAPAAGPQPALATVLAVFLPFGVPSVYVGEYAKGLAHLIIFVLLIFAISSAPGDSGAVFGIAMGFFYFYQIIDAYRSARAVQLHEPPFDPLGLQRTFGGGSGRQVDVSRVPVGAVVLIGLGVLLLLHNAGFFRFFWFGRLWPLILIGIGVWLFVRRSGRC